MRIKDDSKIKNILKIVSPGTNLREGLENILRAKTGGLIVLSDNEEVMKLVHGISEQILELTPIWVEKFRKVRNELVRKQLESLMSSVLIWCINLKAIKYIKKSKFAKFAWKGLTLLQNML